MNKIVNELKLEGKVYYVKRIPLQSGKTLTTFSLGVFNEKKENEKSTYFFIKCTGFEDMPIEDGEDILISGSLKQNKYVSKEGIEKSELVVNFCKLLNSNNITRQENNTQSVIDDEVMF